MSNAASRLVSIFERWRDAASPNRRYSSIRDMPGIGLRETVEAMSCITEIDETLTDMRERGLPVDHMDDAFHVWVDTIIARNVGWNNTVEARSILNSSHLSELRSLSVLIDLDNQHASIEPFVEPLFQRVSALREVLAEDDDLDPWLRDRIYDLVDSAEQILRDRPSPEEVHRIWQDIGVSLLAAQANASKNRQEFWRNLWGQWVQPWSVGVLSGLGTNGFVQFGAAVVRELQQ